MNVSLFVGAFIALFITGEVFGATVQCLIKTASCPSPNYSYLSTRLAAGTFDDGYDGARTSAEKCLARAEPFYKVCEGHQPVTATYVVDGQVKASKTYGNVGINTGGNAEVRSGGSATVKAAQCLIKTSSCPSPNYSHLAARLAAGTFDDGYDGARTSSEKCLARAEPFYKVCKGNQPVTATYVVDDQVKATKTYGNVTTNSGGNGEVKSDSPTDIKVAQCLIKTANCPSPNYSHLAPRLATGTFDDGYNGARTSAEKCLARAEPFYKVCEGHQPVTATYVVDGQVKASKTYNGFLTGAIRWDAWTGAASSVGAIVNSTLSPNKYHDRLPFFAEVLGSNSVNIDGTSQSVMDLEIYYATLAKLSYWAFLYYPDDNTGLSEARKLYRSSSLKNKINYSIIIDGSRTVYLQPQALVEMFQEPNYQRVLNNRPLIYLFGEENQANYVQSIRALCRSKNLPNPYFVLMGFEKPDILVQNAKDIDADAVSRYVVNDSQGNSYTKLTKKEREFWKKIDDKNEDLVPIVTTGWDPRPRVEQPTPWVTYSPDSWVNRPSADEIAVQLTKAFSWISKNPDSVPTKAVIMYAWNEFDEGGWLAPTLKPQNGKYVIDASRIEKIGNVIKRHP